MQDYKIMFFTDDDAEDLHLMQEVTDSLGHKAELFHDGDEMFSSLHSEQPNPDIIFLDITMPKVNGFEVLQKLRSLDERFKGIPVVIHSSNCDEKCIWKCFELGASYYMTKAFSFYGLKKSLGHAIGKDWENFKPSRENFLHTH